MNKNRKFLSLVLGAMVFGFCSVSAENDLYNEADEEMANYDNPYAESDPSMTSIYDSKMTTDYENSDYDDSDYNYPNDMSSYQENYEQEEQEDSEKINNEEDLVNQDVETQEMSNLEGVEPDNYTEDLEVMEAPEQSLAEDDWQPDAYAYGSEATEYSPNADAYDQEYQTSASY